MNCPKCNSSLVEKKNTMMDRGLTICFIEYCECKDCGNTWEPKKDIRMRLSWKDMRKEISVPDESTLRITYPNGKVWEPKIKYLDPTHYMLNGCTYHMDQFAEHMDDYPGTTVEVIE